MSRNDDESTPEEEAAACSAYVCSACDQRMTRWSQFEEHQHDECGGLVVRRVARPPGRKPIAFNVPTVEEQWAARSYHDVSRDHYIKGFDQHGRPRLINVHHCSTCDRDALDARLMRDAGDEDTER